MIAWPMMKMGRTEINSSHNFTMSFQAPESFTNSFPLRRAFDVFDEMDHQSEGHENKSYPNGR
jgi:hypothetical protein